MQTTEEVLKALIGAQVVAIGATNDRSLLLSDGREVAFELTGDCCSSSHFTAPGQFAELVGATILDVEDRQGRSDNNLPDPSGSDVVSWHFLVFTTNKGHVTIDWHNDSNGYYDGTLYARFVDSVRTPTESPPSP